MVEIVKPGELKVKIKRTVPDSVIEIINDLIAQKWNGKEASITCEEFRNAFFAPILAITSDSEIYKNSILNARRDFVNLTDAAETIAEVYTDAWIVLSNPTSDVVLNFKPRSVITSIVY